LLWVGGRCEASKRDVEFVDGFVGSADTVASSEARRRMATVRMGKRRMLGDVN
jgi:hypothetical protein